MAHLKSSNDIISLPDSSDESGDEVVPLKLIKSRMETLVNDDAVSYKDLNKYSMERCDFCEMIFHNRYDMIIHNAEHIIIPVIKQEAHTCSECLSHFASAEQLHHHKLTKHNITNNHSILRNLLEKQPIIKCNDDLKELFIKKPSSIKSRLIFEDDEDFNSIEVDYNETKPILCNGVINNLKFTEEENEQDNSGFVYDNKISLRSRETQAVEKDLPPSIHYEELIKPGLFRCKRCIKSFPNRFQAIIHEATHMYFKRKRKTYVVCPLCERYLAGHIHSLRRHHKKEHSTEPRKRNYFQRQCGRCGLRYHNSRKHYYLYHYNYTCTLCGLKCNNEENLKQHKEEHKQGFYMPLWKDKQSKTCEKTSMLKLCEVCCLFLKNQCRVKYSLKGEYSKMGEKQLCERCNKESFGIMLVKRTRLVRMEKLKYEGDEECKKKPLSNENRLKNIQQRLKKLNKLTKF